MLIVKIPKLVVSLEEFIAGRIVVARDLSHFEEKHSLVGSQDTRAFIRR
jgi:hypothetical protein